MTDTTRTTRRTACRDCGSTFEQARRAGSPHSRCPECRRRTEEASQAPTRVVCVACGESFMRPPRRRQGKLTQRCDRCRIWTDYVRQSLPTDRKVIGPGRTVARRNAEAPRDADWRRFRVERSRLDPTVEELAHLYLANLAERKRVSVADWAGVLSRHVLPAFGAMKPAEIGSADLVAWIDLKRSDGYSEMTVGNLVAAFRAMLEFARTDLGIIDRNPAREIPQNKRPSRKPRDPMRRAAEVLSPESAAPLFFDERLPFDRRLLWATLFLTGARISEAGGLEWRDVNRSLRPLAGLTIARSMHNKSGQLVEGTKDGYTKTVPIHPVLLDLIDDARGWFRSAFRRPPEPTDPLCARALPWREAGRWLERSAIHWFREDCTKIGIQDPPTGPRTLHSTRHSFISNLLTAGVPEIHARGLTHVGTVIDRRDAFGTYVHLDHAVLSRAVLALKVPR